MCIPILTTFTFGSGASAGADGADAIGGALDTSGAADDAGALLVIWGGMSGTAAGALALGGGSTVTAVGAESIAGLSPGAVGGVREQPTSASTQTREDRAFITRAV
jgi:hypothetical protein